MSKCSKKRLQHQKKCFTGVQLTLTELLLIFFKRVTDSLNWNGISDLKQHKQYLLYQNRHNIYVIFYFNCIRFQITRDPCNSIGLISTIYSLIAPFYALNRILFSSVNETALQKHNNQSDFKARLKKPIKLQ